MEEKDVLRIVDTKLISALNLRLKKLEDATKELLEISALKTAVKEHGDALKRFNPQAAHDRAMLTKNYTELVNLEVAKMDKKWAKTELLEARLKGMETMMRSMEQTLDMLQRKR